MCINPVKVTAAVVARKV